MYSKLTGLRMLGSRSLAKAVSSIVAKEGVCVFPMAMSSSKSACRAFSSNPLNTMKMSGHRFNWGEKAEEESSSTEGVSVGRVYHDLTFRGRNGKPLALGDLRKLLQQCTEPAHGKYAVGSVDLFQKKKQDFSEEVCSHFVRAVAEDGKAPMQAARVLGRFRNRLGAWLTPNSALRLMNALSASEADWVDSEANNDKGDNDNDNEDSSNSKRRILNRDKPAGKMGKRAKDPNAPDTRTKDELCLQVLEVCAQKGLQVSLG